MRKGEKKVDDGWLGFYVDHQKCLFSAEDAENSCCFIESVNNLPIELRHVVKSFVGSDLPDEAWEEFYEQTDEYFNQIFEDDVHLVEEYVDEEEIDDFWEQDYTDYDYDHYEYSRNERYEQYGY